MEKSIKIRTGKNTIYGSLRPGRRKDNLIIFVHGLGGHMNEHQFYNSAEFFSAKGYNVFRFDFYSGEKDSKTLRQSTLALHAHDLEKIIKYFKSKFKNIYLVGHSIAGPVILTTNIGNVRAVVLWDPSYNLRDRKEEDLVPAPALKAYVINWGTEILMGQAMRQEWKKFPLTRELLKSFAVPLKVITAGRSKQIIKDWRQDLKSLKIPKEFKVIPKATHTFPEEGVANELFRETLSWIKRF